MGDEVDFLPADKHKSFLQFVGITLAVQTQACPKYSRKMQLILDEVDFLPAGKR